MKAIKVGSFCNSYFLFILISHFWPKSFCLKIFDMSAISTFQVQQFYFLVCYIGTQLGKTISNYSVLWYPKDFLSFLSFDAMLHHPSLRLNFELCLTFELLFNTVCILKAQRVWLVNTPFKIHYSIGFQNKDLFHAKCKTNLAESTNQWT